MYRAPTAQERDHEIVRCVHVRTFPISDLHEMIAQCVSLAEDHRADVLSSRQRVLIRQRGHADRLYAGSAG